MHIVIGLSPALAVALLTLLVSAVGLTYLLSIATSSLALTVLFRLWRRFSTSVNTAPLPASRSTALRGDDQRITEAPVFHRTSCCASEHFGLLKVKRGQVHLFQLHY